MTYNHGQITLGQLLLSQSRTHFRNLGASPSPLINVGHKLVHFRSCTLFLICFPQTTLNGKGRGLQKNPECVRKTELKHKTLYCPNEFVHDCLNTRLF